MKRKLTALAAIAAAALVAASVGVAALASSRSAAEPDRVAAELTAAAGNGDSSPAQVTALDDGMVTVEEMNTAVGATVTCMTDKGHLTAVVPGTGRKPASITFAAPTMEQAEAARLDLADCQAKHSADLLRVWVEQNRPTESEAAEARAFVASCTAERGGKITTSTPTDLELSQWMDNPDPVTFMALGACFQLRREVYGF